MSSAPTICSVKGVPRFHAPFPPVRLSEKDCQTLHDATEQFLNEGVQDFERLTQRHGAHLRLPSDHYKLVRQHGDLRVYLQRKTPGHDLVDESHVQTLVTVGQVEGAVADCLYAACCPTMKHVRVKSAYLHDNVVNGAVIQVLLKPTTEEPYRSMSIRWYVNSQPFLARAFIRNRDASFVEATGMTAFSTGEVVGYHLLLALSLPQLLPVQEYHRFEFSTISLWREHSIQRSEMFVKTFANLKEPKMTTTLTLRSLVSSSLLIGENATFGYTKKLAWMLRQKHGTSDRSETPMMIRSSSTQTCCSCSKRLVTSRPPICELCGFPICGDCQVTKTLCSVTPLDHVQSYEVQLCHPCWLHVVSTNAEAIAVEEALHMALAPLDEYEDSTHGGRWRQLQASMHSATTSATDDYPRSEA